MDKEKIYNVLMSILLMMEDQDYNSAKSRLEQLTDNIKYDTGRY